MKAYLAAAWSRREEVALIAERLRRVGVEITSKWLEEEPCPPSQMKQKFLRERAYRDLEDIDRADMIVRFSDADEMEAKRVPSRLLSGARLGEFLYAKAKGKSLVVVGGHQNVFDYMDGIVHVNTVDDLVDYLSEE